MRIVPGLALAGLMVIGIVVGEQVSPEPHHVLLVGDSIMRQTGPALDAELDGSFAVHNRGVNNSGYLTPDFYDWERVLSGFEAKFQPDTVVMLAIGNYVPEGDEGLDQRWLAPDGSPVDHDSAAFGREWGAATDRLLDDLVATNPDVEVILVLPPPMPTDRTQSIVDGLRTAYQEVGDRRAEVTVVDSYVALAGRRDGFVGRYRTGDAVHLNEQGQRRLARLIAPTVEAAAER